VRCAGAAETFVAPVDEALTPAPPEPGGDAAERARPRGGPHGVETLPHAQREAIELAYYAGLTQTEIAERLKQPLGNGQDADPLGLDGSARW
jgi:RNA polymerase sigma-70 factor (ECF subfamily)